MSFSTLRDACSHSLADQRDHERRDAVGHVQPVRRRGPASEQDEADEGLRDDRRLGDPEQRPEHDRGARVLAEPAHRAPSGGQRVGREDGDAEHDVDVRQGVPFRTM